MKQIKKILISIAVFFVLTACSSTETTKQSEGANEILENSFLAMQQLKSYSIEMNTDQTITLPEQEPMDMKMAMTGDIIIDPMQLYITQEIISPELGTDEPMTAEIYFVNDGFYMQDPTTNSWIKYSGEYANSLLELQKSQMNPEEQLNLLKKFTKNISAEEDESNYILTLEADGEVLKEIVTELIGVMGEDMSLFEGVFDDMTISTFNYKIYIDKETYYQTKMDVEMEFSMKMEDQTMSIKQFLTSTISNYDNVDEITIPQEVLDSAEEISLDDMMNN